MHVWELYIIDIQCIRMLAASAFQWYITQYLHCTRKFNKIPILVTIVTHNFPPTWFPWQPKSCDLWTVSMLTRIPNMMKIGLTLTKLLSGVALFSNMFSKRINLPYHSCEHCWCLIYNSFLTWCLFTTDTDHVWCLLLV